MNHLHNKGINGELEAWLTFLGCDEPEYIVRLIRQYPYFKPLYQDLYDMCSNIERMMNMFSKELQILDRNTIKYMIDELQEQLDAANDTIAKKDAAIANDKATIANKDKTISDMTKTIADLQSEIERLKNNQK